MQITALVVGILYTAGLGFWVMKKMDAFLQGPDFRPLWDESEEESPPPDEPENHDFKNK